MKIPFKIRARVADLMRNATRAELCLLRPLEILCQRYDLSLQFQRPIKLGDYRWAIADFLLDKKLVIELDGAHHFEDEEQQRYDRERDGLIEQVGFKVLRMPNSKVLADPLGVAIDLVNPLLKERGEEIKMSKEELSLEVERLLLRQLGISVIL